MISNRFINTNLRKMIFLLSKFTPGIYYVHLPIKLYFSNIFNNIKNKELSGAIYIYVISYIICFFGKIICRNTKFIHLFQ